MTVLFHREQNVIVNWDMNLVSLKNTYSRETQMEFSKLSNYFFMKYLFQLNILHSNIHKHAYTHTHILGHDVKDYFHCGSQLKNILNTLVWRIPK